MSVNIMTAGEITTAIGRIATTSKALQSDIHTTAVSTLAHIRDHGDTTLAVRLLDALANGQRLNALAFWYSRFSAGKAVMSKGKDGQWKCNLNKDRAISDFDIEGANDTNFADLTKEPKVEPMDIKAFEKLLKRIGDNDGVFPGTTTEKVTPAVRALAAACVALTREKTAKAA
jgi:hypothetical protein